VVKGRGMWQLATPHATHKIAALLLCNNEILQKELVALKIAKVALDSVWVLYLRTTSIYYYKYFY